MKPRLYNDKPFKLDINTDGDYLNTLEDLEAVKDAAVRNAKDLRIGE